MKIARLILNILLAPVVLAGAIGLAVLLVKSKKPPQTVTPPKAVARVEVVTLTPGSITPEVKSFGNTTSYLETELSTQVSGEIIELSPQFDVGKFVSKGDWLVKINPADYNTILAEQKSAVSAARRTLAEEEAKSKQAREDWQSLMKRSISRAPDFTLRIPQLEAAKVALEAALASQAKAELDVQRTTISAPFDAIVGGRTASLGEVVSVGAVLGNLIARERAEVRLPLTPEQSSLVDLKRVKDQPIEVVLTAPARPGLEWKGLIKRIDPVIDTQNRTVQVIAEIENPFDPGGQVLPIGAFVNARIDGVVLEKVYQLPESSVVEDSYIWCVDPKGKIKRQPIRIIARQASSLIARIDEPVIPGAPRMIQRPLASFQEGQEVEIVTPSKL
ncbi:MAG: efflux RND transporter periplasmic adaptor subunit [Verrucomicrobiales bacterium]|nr:efflux RND transporter periplasmic adaptor subunit [Verrucomicrobiales bacterium]